MMLFEHYGFRWTIVVGLELNWPDVRVERDRTHTALDLALPFAWIVVSRRRNNPRIEEG